MSEATTPAHILLITGKGGVGKTTVAAATAVAGADLGLRTLVMSTDSAHSLADAFDEPLENTPRMVAEGLWAQQIDAHTQLESFWDDIRDQLMSVFQWGGSSGIQVEEFLVFPGMEELFALLEVNAHATSGEFDLVVVDCAPTAETLRLLTLPEVLSWYVERVMPTERRLMKAARPILNRVSNLPVPEDRVFDSVEAVFAGIQAAHQLLTDPRVAGARLVVNAEKMVVAEAKRTYTYLGFFGYAVDGVIVNRVLPDAVDGSYFDEWKKVQERHLTTIEESFGATDVLRLRLFDQEMVGVDRLRRLGKELYRDRHPVEGFSAAAPFAMDESGSEVSITFTVPFVDGSEVDVLHRGNDLSVTVGPHRRSMVLPDAFRRRAVTGAKLAGGELRIEFGAATP